LGQVRLGARKWLQQKGVRAGPRMGTFPAWVANEKAEVSGHKTRQAALPQATTWLSGGETGWFARI